MPTPLLVVLAAAGITFWITQSEMGGPIRNTVGRISFFGRMFECAFCTGFWAGLLSAVAVGTVAALEGQGVAWLHDGMMALLIAFASAIAALALDSISELADAQVGMYALQARLEQVLDARRSEDDSPEE